MFFVVEKMVELIGGGCVINDDYPVQFLTKQGFEQTNIDLKKIQKFTHKKNVLKDRITD